MQSRSTLRSTISDRPRRTACWPILETYNWSKPMTQTTMTERAWRLDSAAANRARRYGEVAEFMDGSPGSGPVSAVGAAAQRSIAAVFAGGGTGSCATGRENRIKGWVVSPPVSRMLFTSSAPSSRQGQSHRGGSGSATARPADRSGVSGRADHRTDPLRRSWNHAPKRGRGADQRRASVVPWRRPEWSIPGSAITLRQGCPRPAPHSLANERDDLLRQETIRRLTTLCTVAPARSTGCTAKRCGHGTTTWHI